MSPNQAKNSNKHPPQDKYTKLLRYVKEKKPDKFVRFMNAHDVNVTHEYGSPDNGTLLEIACRSAGNSKIVETLIQHNAPVNFINTIFGKAPIHDIVQNEDIDTLRILLQSTKCDPHIQDKYGNCVLHYAAVRKNLPIVRILKQYLDPDIVAWKLVDLALVDLVNYHTSDLMRKELRCLLEHNTTEKLFNFLYNRQSDQFIERIQELKTSMGNEFLYDNDGCNSYMQYACKAGFISVVITLLESEIDPNHYCYRNPMNPLMISAFQGYHRILKIFLDHPDISLKSIGQHNVLHCLFYGMFMNRNYTPNDDEPCDYRICLDYLHKKAIQGNKLDVNSADEEGYAPLHYAVQLNHKEAIMLLIDAGADVCQKNCNGQTPLSLINASTLEEYLDSCISFNDVHCGDKNHIVIFRYNIFTPRSKTSSRKPHVAETDPVTKNEIQDYVSEIGPLVEMTKTSELRNLLKHPVTMSFVTLKWHVVKKFFFINAILYLIFGLATSSYLCLAYSGSIRSDTGFNRSKQLLNETLENFTKLYNSDRDTHKHLGEVFSFLRKSLVFLNNTDRNAGQNWTFRNSVATFLCLPFASLLFLVLCFRELFKISIQPRHHVKSLENWLIIILIILTGIPLATIPFGKTFSYNAIAPAATFIIWLEFVFLLGRYPSLATNYEMFKKFSYSFLKFIHWFFLLIFAYGISLYVRFHQESYDHFRDLLINPFVSIFQSFVINPGEIYDIHIQDLTKTIYLAVLLYVAIVFFNLLNGLAVTDTQQIRSEAELLEIIARVKFISHLETIAFTVPDSYRRFFNKLMCSKKSRNCVEKFYRGLHLFPYLFADRTVHVSPNIGNQVLYVTTDENTPDQGPYMVLSRWKIDSGTVKKAMKIYEKRLERKYSEVDYDQIIAELMQQKDMYQIRIDKLESEIDRLMEENTRVQTLQDRNSQSLKEITDYLKSKS